MWYEARGIKPSLRDRSIQQKQKQKWNQQVLKLHHKMKNKTTAEVTLPTCRCPVCESDYTRQLLLNSEGISHSLFGTMLVEKPFHRK